MPDGERIGFKFQSKEAARRPDALYARLGELNARCGWCVDYTANEYFQVRVEFWFTPKGQYMIRIFDDGGWDVFGQLDTTNTIDACLAKIV